MLCIHAELYAACLISPRAARSDQPRRRLAGDGFTQTPQEFFFTQATPFFITAATGSNFAGSAEPNFAQAAGENFASLIIMLEYAAENR